MRILHVTQGYFPAIGGTEFLMQRISEEMVRQFGDEVTVFTTNCLNGEAFHRPDLPHLPVGWEERAGVRIRRFPVRRRMSQLLRRPQAIAYKLRLPFNDYLRALAGGPIVPELRRAIRECPSDVIAASSFPLLHMFDAIEGGAGRPCVLIGGLHPEDRWGYDRPMIYRAIRRARAYVAYTKYEADYVIGRGADPRRVFVTGAGVDPEKFAGLSQSECKQRLGFDGAPVVGYIGQIGGHKGVDTLVRAMPLVWQKMPEVNLLIAGGRTLFVEKVERLLNRWPESARLRTRFYLDFPPEEKPSLFNAIDVFAHASGYESFGIAFLEAWAAGKPVIGTTAGATPTVVTEGATGVLVPYKNEGALADAILSLLKHPERAKAMGEAGRQRVLQKFTWSEIARRFHEVYQLALRPA
jgi:glycosyltransferase involved in cell wall biosynthesis